MRIDPTAERVRPADSAVPSAPTSAAGAEAFALPEGGFDPLAPAAAGGDGVRSDGGAATVWVPSTAGTAIAAPPAAPPPGASPSGQTPLAGPAILVLARLAEGPPPTAELPVSPEPDGTPSEQPAAAPGPAWPVAVAASPAARTPEPPPDEAAADAAPKAAEPEPAASPLPAAQAAIAQAAVQEAAGSAGSVDEDKASEDKADEPVSDEIGIGEASVAPSAVALTEAGPVNTGPLAMGTSDPVGPPAGPAAGQPQPAPGSDGTAPSAPAVTAPNLPVSAATTAPPARPGAATAAAEGRDGDAPRARDALTPQDADAPGPPAGEVSKPLDLTTGPPDLSPSLASGPAPRAPEAPSPNPLAAPLPDGAEPSVPPVPLGAVPVEIGLRVLQGQRQFEIRLDPEELGRVDVSLAIDESGEVTAHLAVERVETLHLLQRDARTLERALEQAGLKPSEGGVELSLKDPGSDRPGERMPDGRSPRRDDPEPRRSDRGEAVPPHSPAPARHLWRGRTGVDLRI